MCYISAATVMIIILCYNGLYYFGTHNTEPALSSTINLLFLTVNFQYIHDIY